MSIVRIGLAETKKFAEGYDAIFGKKEADEAKSSKEAKKPAAGKSKAEGKKKSKK